MDPGWKMERFHSNSCRWVTVKQFYLKNLNGITNIVLDKESTQVEHRYVRWYTVHRKLLYRFFMTSSHGKYLQTPEFFVNLSMQDNSLITEGSI
jgi:hypothetical protein